jgi:hypothetical protein
MTPAELAATSGRDLACRRAIVAAYETLTALVARAGELDAMGVAAAVAAADAALDELGAIATTLRADGAAATAVPEPAARAAELNLALAAEVDRRRRVATNRLASLGASRRALAAYRAAGAAC